MTDISASREKIQSLITKFDKDKHHYLQKGYLEAQVRIDFLNPFFEALNNIMGPGLYRLLKNYFSQAKAARLSSPKSCGYQMTTY